VLDCLRKKKITSELFISPQYPLLYKHSSTKSPVPNPKIKSRKNSWDEKPGSRGTKLLSERNLFESPNN